MVSLICYKFFSQHYYIHQLKDILKCWSHPQTQRQTYTIKFTAKAKIDSDTIEERPSYSHNTLHQHR